MKTDVHFSSASEEWSTPQGFFDSYNKEWKFTLDVCAGSDNTKCERYFDKEANGLTQDWGKNTCWMNPPYGRTIKDWMRKALEASRLGATVVCLVPSRTDTTWWHEYAMKGKIEFLRGRLKFNHHHNSAPFPSAVVVFQP